MKDKIGLIKTHSGDIFLLTILSISIFGAVMIFSTTAQQSVNPYEYFIKQLRYIFLGLFISFVFSKINFRNYKKITEIFLFFTIVLLIYVLFFTREIKGANRWISLPVLGNFQPAELAKISIVMFIAKFVDNHRSKIIAFKQETWILLGVIFLICGLIIIQPDIGIPIVIFSTSTILLFISGLKIKFMIKVIFPIIIVLAISILFVPHRIKRMTTFMDPWKYQKKEGYQLIQSYLALSYGNIFGRGLGKSQFKEFYLPEAHTDFIFSVIGEELGFIGTVLVLLVFMFLFFISTKMVEQTRSFYGALLIYGLVLNIVLQSFVNIAVTAGLLPTKGLGLPFISYGGSALITNFISVGIILGVWKQNQKKF